MTDIKKNYKTKQNKIWQKKFIREIICNKKDVLTGGAYSKNIVITLNVSLIKFLITNILKNTFCTDF